MIRKLRKLRARAVRWLRGKRATPGPKVELLQPGFYLWCEVHESTWCRCILFKASDPGALRIENLRCLPHGVRACWCIGAHGGAVASADPEPEGDHLEIRFD